MKRRSDFWSAVFAVFVAYLLALALANWSACEQWDKACLVSVSPGGK